MMISRDFRFVISVTFAGLKPHVFGMKIVRFSLVPMSICRPANDVLATSIHIYSYMQRAEAQEDVTNTVAFPAASETTPRLSRPQDSQKQHFDKMIPGRQNARFVEIAESLKPQLKTRVEHALRVVKVERDETSLMGWKAVDAGRVEDVGSLNGGDQVIYDFGKSVQYVLAGEEGVVSSGSLVTCYSMSL